MFFFTTPSTINRTGVIFIADKLTYSPLYTRKPVLLKKIILYLSLVDHNISGSV